MNVAEAKVIKYFLKYSTTAVCIIAHLARTKLVLNSIHVPIVNFTAPHLLTMYNCFELGQSERKPASSNYLKTMGKTSPSKVLEQMNLYISQQRRTVPKTPSKMTNVCKLLFS